MYSLGGRGPTIRSRSSRRSDITSINDSMMMKMISLELYLQVDYFCGPSPRSMLSFRGDGGMKFNCLQKVDFRPTMGNCRLRHLLRTTK
jgi:hypothetical protein